MASHGCAFDCRTTRVEVRDIATRRQAAIELFSPLLEGSILVPEDLDKMFMSGYLPVYAFPTGSSIVWCSWVSSTTSPKSWLISR